MHRLTKKQIKTAILTLRSLQKDEKKSPKTLSELSEDIGVPVSSLSSMFKTLTHVKIINKTSGGFEAGENAPSYMLKWLGSAYEMDG